MTRIRRKSAPQGEITQSKIIAAQNPRFIPAAVKRKVWQQAQCQCTHLDNMYKRRCSSTHKLQIDHIIPVAKGGKNDIDNLGLVCAAHNQLYARQHFGDLMDKYLA